MIEAMHLGLPFWGFEGWLGSVYARDSRASQLLGQYARAFNAVEGNTTFYAMPSDRSVERWRAESGGDFRFCFKLPRTITHDALLRDALPETHAFLQRLQPLRDRLGPIMVQLPPGFGARELPRLESFLEALPRDLRFAVELRDPELLADGLPARLVEEMLAAFDVGRVIMDTRPLRDGPGDHPEILAARHKKPDLPVREEALTSDPIARIVFHPDPAINARWLDRWARILARWIDGGLRPLVFVHSPSNRESPVIARELHRRIADLVPVGEMPPWPGEVGESASGQLALL
ncbi:MAG: DUF72 domain-containing protein [Deltaproteobacteria bacterium]|jgi:uncharacterized protein YecE (DUF72 family)|nr:DUF72 domain-containing protein [Deltaproteobacteria bacterium]MBW2495691.1 DUF72 domain-containing protein [Deltaproteobacteria bacterium]